MQAPAPLLCGRWQEQSLKLNMLRTFGATKGTFRVAHRLCAEANEPPEVERAARANGATPVRHVGAGNQSF